MALQDLGRYQEAMANYEQARAVIIDICKRSDGDRNQLDLGIALRHPWRYEQAITGCRNL